MYRVLMDFTDTADNRYIYRAGDEYPRPGVSVSKERIEELSTGKNRRKTPLIELDVTTTATEEPAEGAKEADITAEKPEGEEIPVAKKKGRRPGKSRAKANKE